MHKVLSIDVETYSDEDIAVTGAYRYCLSPNFTILLFAYAFDDEEVQIVDFANGEKLPNEVFEALTNPDIIKSAFNANFERNALKNYFKLEIPPEQWRCSMIAALRLGLPGSLAMVGKALKFPEDKQKMQEGKALIKLFCTPKKVKKNENQITFLDEENPDRNMPSSYPDKWKVFKDYCVQDVVVEREIRKKLEIYSTTKKEHRLWELDQHINDRGVLTDIGLINAAIEIDGLNIEKLTEEAIELTGLSNPNSPAQLKKWLSNKVGYEVDKLTKDSIVDLYKSTDDQDVKRVLKLRTMMAKTSVKKYEAMLKSRCKDGRVRGLLQFYGANKTGRWCLTGDHEILTDKGEWVRLDDWNGGKIACWNINTEAISFQKSEPNAFDYTGDVLSVDAQRCAQISTLDHKMPCWNRSKGIWEPREIKDVMLKRFTIPYVGQMHIKASYNSNQLRVLVMVQADGHYTQDGDLRLRFKKDRKIERCKHLLRKNEIVYQQNKNSDDSTVITVKNRCMPIWLKMFNTKTFGCWLFDESPDVFFDELEYWDSYRSGPNSIQYSTINKRNADIIQAFAAITGRSATLVVKDKDEKWQKAYILNIWLNPLGRSEIRKEQQSIIRFVGKVYCPTTPTGYFLVRRQGKIWITGNCGRLVQVQNLPQNHLEDLDDARELVKSKDLESIEFLYDSVSDTLSQLIRTAFIPSPGNRFIVADFSAIEARVIAWIASEDWRLDVFKNNGDIYCASAEKMFHVPVKKHGVNGHLRQKGKIAELALGYGGSAGAIKSMDKSKSIPEDEIPGLVSDWRNANPNITTFWWDCDKAAKKAIMERTTVELQYGLKFIYNPGVLFIQLPSGRRLSYIRPKIEAHQTFSGNKITYEGMDQTTKQWTRLDTYGPKLVENIVQGIARDCLGEAMFGITEAGYGIVFHVHDELILDVPKNFGSLEEVNSIFGRPISWAPGLPLSADGYECEYYQKD